MKVILAACLTFILSLHPGAIGGPVCKDDDDNPVDWYVGTKLPHLKYAKNPLISSGQALVYITSRTVRQYRRLPWVFSKKLANDSTNFLANTMKAIYTHGHELTYSLYNDEFPNGTVSFVKGHSKGVIAFDKNSGFWLVHSVPKFPPERQRGYSYPRSGTIFGQSFLCISLPSHDISKLYNQLKYNDVFIYDSNVKNSFHNDINYSKKYFVSYNIERFKSLEGQQFISFAKNGKFGKDLYSDLVAPHLKVDLLTETWQNGPHADKMNSECSLTYTVENIKKLKIPTLDDIYKSTEDHSKWALSTSGTWLCVGDINRMTTQTVRGGGTVCVNRTDLHEAYTTLITEVDKCQDSSSLLKNKSKENLIKVEVVLAD